MPSFFSGFFPSSLHLLPTTASPLLLLRPSFSTSHPFILSFSLFSFLFTLLYFFPSFYIFPRPFILPDRDGKTALVNPCTCVRLGEYEFFIQGPYFGPNCVKKRDVRRKLFTCLTSAGTSMFLEASNLFAALI